MYGMRVLRAVCGGGLAPWGNEGGQGGGVDDAHDFVLVRVEPEQAQSRQKVHEEHGHHVRPHRDALGLESPHRLIRARRHRPKNNPVVLRMSSDTTRHGTKGKEGPVLQLALFDELDRLRDGAGVLHVEEEDDVHAAGEFVKDLFERRNLEQSGCPKGREINK